MNTAINESFGLIGNSQLFSDIAPSDWDEVADIFEADIKSFGRGEYIAYAGDRLRYIGIVLSGRIHIMKDDFYGNSVILTDLNRGDAFGETFACGGFELTVNIRAEEDTEVLRIKPEGILKGGTGEKNKNLEKDCGSYHRQELVLTLLRNLVKLFSSKNFFITGRIEHLSKKKTEDKLLSYLTDVERRGKKDKNGVFEINFNRQELADYLAVDRSALSSVMGRLRKRGVLEFKKNKFRIIKRTDSLKEI